METKTTNIENVTLATANENRHRIFDRLKAADHDSAEYSLLGWAYENEGEILCTTKQIDQIVKSIQDRTNEVQRRLKDGCPEGLNSCGILQGLSGELDMAVTKLTHSVKQRSVYKNVLK